MSLLHFLALSWIIACKSAPFAGWAIIASDSPALQPIQSTASESLSFSGETVDGDLPATYRLPPVPAGLPETVVAAEDSLDWLPLFLPPTPTDQERRTRSEEREASGGIAFSTEQPTENSFIAAGSPPGDDTPLPDEFALPVSSPTGPQFTVAEAPPITPEMVVAQAPASQTEASAQLLPAVQRGYVLAQRGAFFAARTEFVQVLRRVAQARDMVGNTDEHSQSLAAGLRALDEASDFVPAGVQLEADLDVRGTASSHRTPALGDEAADLLPHQAVARYHEFARDELAKAVAGEQAGSMALYGLGRIDAQLAERKDDDVRFVRDAMTMYAAALAACPSNHLAANELGVLECRTGRPDEAARLFEHTINFAPTATAYHNLAVAQQKLGFHGDAQANEQESQRLAAMERAGGQLSRRAGVQWVAPEELARVTQPGSMSPPQAHSATTTPATPSPEKSPWQRTLDLTRSLPRPGFRSTEAAELGPAPGTQMARPASGPNQNYLR